MLKKIFLILALLIMLASAIYAVFLLVQKTRSDKGIVGGYEKIPTVPAIINGKTKFSFAVIGDTQRFKIGNRGDFQIAAASLQKIDPDLVFAMGDLVSNCRKTDDCEKDLSDWRRILDPLSARIYPVQGNHDRTGGKKADAAWEKIFEDLPANGPAGFSKSVYSFDFGNSHFVVLNTDKPEENDINEVQMDWLEEDLVKNTQEHIFVFFHEPAYPTNSKVGESLDKNPGSRDRLWEILIKHGVKGVFSGHEHIQSRRRVGGIYQFGFGNTDSYDHLEPKPGTAEYFYIGKAFGLAEVDGESIIVKTYSVQGELLDSFSLPKN